MVLIHPLEVKYLPLCRVAVDETNIPSFPGILTDHDFKELVADFQEKITYIP
jgi:hypothetical protein